ADVVARLHRSALLDMGRNAGEVLLDQLRDALQGLERPLHEELVGQPKDSVPASPPGYPFALDVRHDPTQARSPGGRRGLTGGYAGVHVAGTPIQLGPHHATTVANQMNDANVQP